MPLLRWRRFPRWLGLLPNLCLAGCLASGNVHKPIPTAFYPAPQPATRLVVMLPGRGDSLAGLERHRVAQRIQAQWPHADVVLAGLTLPFYRQGRAPQRLHDEVIAPALARQRRALWLGGISLGGLGALLYDQAYPGQARGLLLWSPYLGDTPIQDEIRIDGGIRQWHPGVPPQPVGPATFQRELWRHIQHIGRTARRCDAWVAYGADERFRDAIELMTPILPADHVLMLPGHHDWALWTPAIGDLLKHVDSAGTCPAR